MTYRVRISPTAKRQGKSLAAWWKSNRPQSRKTLRETLRACFNDLQTFPNRNPRYRRRAARYCRIKGTPYLAIYTVDDEAMVVEIVAIWSGALGDAPEK